MKNAFSRRGILCGLVAVAMPRLASAKDTRPAEWAVPIAMDGVPNLYRISPGLYRSAQPAPEGFQNLAAFGIKTVISFRQTVDDTPLAVGSGLILRRVPMAARHVGDDEGGKIAAALRLVLSSQADGPVLFHCHHGADRTGAVAAVYRMVIQGWSREAALDELLNGGFGFHAVWQNIPDYVTALDVEDMRRKIGA